MSRKTNASISVITEREILHAVLKSILVKANPKLQNLNHQDRFFLQCYIFKNTSVKEKDFCNHMGIIVYATGIFSLLFLYSSISTSTCQEPEIQPTKLTKQEDKPKHRGRHVKKKHLDFKAKKNHPILYLE
jgi:hypothetical protein